MNRSPWRLTRMPRARRCGGPRGSAHSNESSRAVAAPAPTPMRMPRPSSFGVPMRQAESGTWANGHSSATIASLWMKPPAARITPPRARMTRGAVVSLDPDTDDLTPRRRRAPRLGHRPRRGGARRDGRTEPLHEETSGGIHVLGLVPAGHRDRDLVEGVGVLPAAEEQPGVIGRLAVRLVAEGGPERHADRGQPVEMVGRALAVGVEAGLVGLRSERRPEERPHVLRRVVEAAGALERRATPQVDEAAGVGRGAAARHGTFDGQHVGIGLRAATTADEPATPRPTTTTSTVSSKRTSLTSRAGMDSMPAFWPERRNSARRVAIMVALQPA